MKTIEVYYAGRERLKTRYTINKNGQKHGLFQSWYFNKNQHREINYNNGKKCGVYKIWYPNGQQRLEKFYINDQEVSVQ